MISYRVIKEGFIAKDKNGEKLPNAVMYFKEAGTSAPIDTYNSELLDCVNLNPVVSDCEGKFPPIFSRKGEKLKVELKSAEGFTLWTQDDIEYIGKIINLTR